MGGGTLNTRDDTMYRNELLLDATYNIFDFGVKRRRVWIAERDIDVKRMAHKQSIRDIKLKTLSLYADLLAVLREVETKKQILVLYKEVSMVKERLYNSGKISKVELIDEAMKVVKAVDEIDTLKLKIKTISQDISFYTGECYETEGLILKDLDEPVTSGPDSFDFEGTTESRIYALEVKKKQIEIEILRRERYPHLDLNANYARYIDRDNKFSALQDNIRENFYMGISVAAILFEGFKSHADIKRANLEFEKLKIERDRKHAELSARYAKLSRAKQTYTFSIANQKEALEKVTAKLDMLEELFGQKLIEWTDLLYQKIEFLNQQLDFTKAIIARVATTKELELLTDAL
jgi:outer membrane protein TolC